MAPSRLRKSRPGARLVALPTMSEGEEQAPTPPLPAREPEKPAEVPATQEPLTVRKRKPKPPAQEPATPATVPVPQGQEVVLA